MVVVVWSASGLIRWVLSGDHTLSLVIERIYSPAKRGVVRVQHCVCTLDKLRYDVLMNSGMKR